MLKVLEKRSGWFSKIAKGCSPEISLMLKIYTLSYGENWYRNSRIWLRGNTGQSVHHAYNWLGDKFWQEVRSLVQVKSCIPLDASKCQYGNYLRGYGALQSHCKCPFLLLTLLGLTPASTVLKNQWIQCVQNTVNTTGHCPCSLLHPGTAHDLSAAGSAILLSCHCYGHYNCSHRPQSTLLGRHNIIPVLQSITLGVL